MTYTCTRLRLLILATVCALGSLFYASAADEAASMQFVCADGTVYTIAAEGLSLTVTDGTLYAANGLESLNIPLSSLRSFNFSAEAAIDGIIADRAETGPVEIFAIDGSYMGKAESPAQCRDILPAGAYIIRSNVGSFKIVIR